MKRRKRLCEGIETEYLVGEAVGNVNVSGFSHNEIIETVRRGILRSETREYFSVRGDVKDLRAASSGFFFPSVGPDRAVVRIHPDPEDGKQTLLLGLQKIADAAFEVDLHDFPAMQTAQIKDFAFWIPGETFWNKVLIFCDQRAAGLRNYGKVVLYSFGHFGKGMFIAEACKFGAT